MRNKPKKISYQEALTLYEKEKEKIQDLCKENNIELKKISYAGSLRRERKFIGDIDIVIELNDPEFFGELLQEKHDYYYKKNGDFYRGVNNKISIDLFVAGKYDYYSMLFFLTGSESWNLKLMSHLYRNEIAVFTPFTIRRFSDRSVLYFNSEEDIFNVIGIEKVEPKSREIKNIRFL